MSTLNVANISDGTDTVETGYVINGSAKAWATYNQTTPAVVESSNVSSLTDSATGDALVNLTNGMATTTYYTNAVASNVSTDTSNNLSAITVNGYFGTPQNTTSSIQVYSSYVSAVTSRTQADHDYVAVEAKGDLA